MDVIATLKAEETRLEAVLRETVVYRQLEAVRVALASLSVAYGVQPGERYLNTPGADKRVPTFDHLPRNPRAESLSSAAARLAIAEMRRTGRRLSSSALIPLLAAEGKSVPGKKPQATVASALSAQRDTFNNARDDRGVGYGLREWTDASRHILGVNTEIGHDIGAIPPDAHMVEEVASSADSDSPLRPARREDEGDT